MKGKSKGWTEARRKRQAANCRERQPWAHSTGPRTPEGKAAVSQNAVKHGMRGAEMIEVRHVLFLQRRYIKTLMAGLSLRDNP